MAGFQVVRVGSSVQMQQALDIRRRVFVEEQGVPVELEIDAYDTVPSDALHVLAMLEGAPIATGRLLLGQEDGMAHIGRVAVLLEHRGRGFGREVMLELHALAREQGLQSITLAAQLHAIGFYQRLGYAAHGDVFLDAGIEHRWMDLAL